jgi:tetratricopeptide (TPR) repeat protein
MPLVDHQPVSSNSVTELVSDHRSSLNQPIYLRLRLALSLNLRRQTFIAVCDDVRLRDRFAAKLQADLETSPLNFGVEESKPKHAANGNSSMGKADVPRLVTLNLSLSNPNLLEQIHHWRSATPPRIKSAFDPITSFQIIGIEQLTRQPVHLQRDFLNSLQTLAHQFATVDFNLVLWVSRPWCRSILQSVPEFWQWHTGVFEFEGDPTPVGEAKRTPQIIHPSTVRRPPSAVILQPPVVSPQPLPIPAKSQADLDLTHLVLATVEQEIAATEASSPREVEHSSEPLRILQHLEALHLEQAPAAALSAAYQQLGDCYRERLEQGNSSAESLTIAIRAYEQVLRLLEPDSSGLPDLLNDIGNLYWMLSRQVDQLPNLEKAIKAYQFALGEIDPETRSQTYAMIQNNLGSVYGDLACREDPVDNLQRAIEAYQNALMVRSAADDSSRYAATQNNLGTAFWNLAQHKTPILNLQGAIGAYIEALHHYDSEQEPFHYAMIQNNLGTAYWNLSQCPRSHDPSEQLNATPEDFLMLAIGAYRIALIYRTLESAPAANAATQNNLGTAYWHLANLSSTHYDDRAQNLRSAIAAYQAALAAAHSLATVGAPPLTFDVWAAHNNLGSAYHQLATDDRANLDAKTRSHYLEASLFHHVQAVQGWQEKPDFYQNAMAHLVQTVRTLHDRQGIQGQTLAFSKIPAQLIPTVMKQL